MSQPFLWRRVNDSSGFAEPRVFIRVYLEPGSIDAAIAFYEDLQGVAHDMRFDFPETPDTRRSRRLPPAGGQRRGAGAVPQHHWHPAGGRHRALSPALAGCRRADHLRAGARATGACFNALLPDGTVVEFVHHRPQPGEA